MHVVSYFITINPACLSPTKNNCRLFLLQHWVACAGAFGNIWTPGAPLTNFNDGVVQQRFIFYTRKDHNFRICLPKKSLYFLAYPKKSLSSWFFATHKNPSFFCNPKKYRRLSKTQKKTLLAKISDPKNHSDPPPPPPPSLKMWVGPLGLGPAVFTHIMV